jgi:hypothetical protein
MLPSNIDIDAFRAGYFSLRKEAGPLDWINSKVEGYFGNRMGAAMKPTLDSMQQSGIKFDRNAQGLPVNFDANQSINNVGKGYISNLGTQASNWLGSNWEQIKNSPMDWVKNNPWTAGGAAVLGGGLLYGGGRMAGLWGGGNKPAMPRPSAYGIPGRGVPQAIEKYSGINPLMQTSMRFPLQVANSVTHKSPQGYGQMEQQPYEPTFHADDENLRKLLQEPKMRSYLINLLATSNG